MAAYHQTTPHRCHIDLHGCGQTFVLTSKLFFKLTLAYKANPKGRHSRYGDPIQKLTRLGYARIAASRSYPPCSLRQDVQSCRWGTC